MRGLLRFVTRRLLRPVLAPAVRLDRQRRRVDALAGVLRPLREVVRYAETLAALPVLRCTPPQRKLGWVTLYLHGGGYVVGSPQSHGDLAAALAKALATEVWLLDYRLAPEHPWPAALEDALLAYRELAQREAVERIVVVGDSAGGGLALALTLALRNDPSLPAPHRLVLLSPWVDLDLGGASIATHAERDPMLTREWLAACAAHVRGPADIADPLLAPLSADLAGLPPLLIQVGADEILASDAERLAVRARDAGAVVEFKSWEGMWHDFQALHGWLPEADEALREIGEFVARRP